MSGKSQANVSHIANYTDNYGTATTTANKSMGFDLSATPSCCQAQLQLSAQLKAELALVPIDPATRHPPATHPQEKLKRALEISQTISIQFLLSRQCLDSV